VPTPATARTAREDLPSGGPEAGRRYYVLVTAETIPLQCYVSGVNSGR